MRDSHNLPIGQQWELYNLGRPLIRDVLLCFLSVTNGAAQKLQYQPNGQWNM